MRNGSEETLKYVLEIFETFASELFFSLHYIHSDILNILNCSLHKSVLVVFSGLMHESLSGCTLIFFFSVTPSSHRESLSATTVHPDIDPWVGMIIEAWLTSILVFTVFGATDSTRRKVFFPSFPIGMAIALDIMAGVSLSSYYTLIVCMRMIDTMVMLFIPDTLSSRNKIFHQNFENMFLLYHKHV